MGDSDDGKNPFYHKNKNPFADDDDIDDESFLRPSTSSYLFSTAVKKRPSLYFPPADSSPRGGDADLLAKKKETQSRTVASTERSLAVLMESEAIGEGIAKELTEQKEQLENCHRKVDDINANLRNSQKHLRRIKSIFGGLKDFLMGVKIKPVKSTNPFDDVAPTKKSSSSKNETVPLKQIENRPRNTAVPPGPSGNGDKVSSHPGMLIRASDGDKADKDPNDVIDNNLGLMLNHVKSLKSLAVDLGEELDTQNDLIDSLNDKTEEAQISLSKQNKDISKLLK